MIERLIRGMCLVVFASIITGCADVASFLSTPTPVPASQATSTPRAIPTSTSSVPAAPNILRVWIPPRFDPGAKNPAAELLQTRLIEFQREHPALQVEFRVKPESDILNALSVTMNAAPEAMPDLIALSYSDMQGSAAAGFLHPLEGLTSILQDPDWYGFARELGQYQNREYGIPFAGDALLMVYRSSAFTEEPVTWESIFDSDARMVFPISDPTALFALSLYLSENGQLVDEHSKVTLEEAALVRLFSFFGRAIEAETALPFTRDYQTDAQVLQFFKGGGAEVAVIHASSGVQSPGGEYLPLLGLNNVPYTIGDGWVWALAGSNVENQPLAVELASYLVESNFMSEWTRASGYLPVRPQALNRWDDETLRIPLNEVLQSAYPVPPETVTAEVGLRLQQALIRIFSGEQPEAVARSVIESLK